MPADARSRIFPLDHADHLIGRRSDKEDIHPEIVIDDPGISRRHARILRAVDGTLSLLDLGSDERHAARRCCRGAERSGRAGWRQPHHAGLLDAARRDGALMSAVLGALGRAGISTPGWLWRAGGLVVLLGAVGRRCSTVGSGRHRGRGAHHRTGRRTLGGLGAADDGDAGGYERGRSERFRLSESGAASGTSRTFRDGEARIGGGPGSGGS